jgi:hypothetical protein
MALNFLQPYLDSRITFSRGTNATLVDSTGNITYAPANLLTYSQEFENAAWTKTNATITANTEIAPDGTMTADTFTATAANGVIRNDPAKVGTFINSIYVKRKTGTGAVQILNAAGSYTAVTVTSEWTRVSAAALATGASLFGVRLVVSGDEIYIWGAQAEQVTYQTTPGTYNATTASAYYGPRFDYDPVTLAPRGLLIEETRTNLLLQSETFDNASWPKTDATVTANVTNAPSGTAVADKLAETATTAAHSVSQIVTIAIGTSYTYTVYAKAAERNWIALQFTGGMTANHGAYFDLANGVVGNLISSPASASITKLADGWYRCSITSAPATGTSTTAWVYTASGNGVVSYLGTAGSGVYIWGAQFEAGAFATSYIPTVASTVSRSADIATMTGTNFSTWYNQSAGTFVIDADSYTIGSADYPLTASDGTSNNRFGFYRTTATIAGYVTTGAVDQMYLTRGSIATNTPYKAAVTATANDGNMALNGTAAAGDTSITMPTLDRLSIGSNNSSGFMSGHIRTIAYYNTRLPNTQLQALTT